MWKIVDKCWEMLGMMHKKVKHLPAKMQLFPIWSPGWSSPMQQLLGLHPGSRWTHHRSKCGQKNKISPLPPACGIGSGIGVCEKMWEDVKGIHQLLICYLMLPIMFDCVCHAKSTSITASNTLFILIQIFMHCIFDIFWPYDNVWLCAMDVVCNGLQMFATHGACWSIHGKSKQREGYGFVCLQEPT